MTHGVDLDCGICEGCLQIVICLRGHCPADGHHGDDGEKSDAFHNG